MQNIFLIGLSGSGKSTVGRILAERLGTPFLDIDALIEEECGERIPAIFAQRGEEHFRACESRMLAKAASMTDGAVIATGVGIVTREENRALMAERGIRVFLEVVPETALERLQAQQTAALASGALPETRLLLAGPNPLANLYRLMALCAKWYNEADFTCVTQGKTAEQVAQMVVALLVGSGKLTGIAPIVLHEDKTPKSPP